MKLSSWLKLSSDKKRLFENFISLSVLQGANYILPLLTVPYLVRVLGPAKFGLVTFAQALIQYFVILTDYGFNLSATRKISIYRDDKEKVSQIFSAVMHVKVLFMLLSLLILVLMVVAIPKFRFDWEIYLYTFGMVIGNVMFPVWFFQGMERMKYITFLNILAKLIFTVAIFFFIKKQSDYLYVPIINSVGFIVAGVLSLYIVLKNFSVDLKKVQVSCMLEELKDGWHIFISSVAISLYTVSNTFILGLFTNSTVVGYYGAGEKLIKAVQGLLSPVSQVVYPYINKLAAESKDKALVFIKKILFVIGGITFIISSVLFIFAKSIVLLVLGKQYVASILVLRILAFLPSIIALSNVFGIQTMLTFQMNRAFSKILVTAGMINIIMALSLVSFYQHIGIAVSVLITELFVTVTMFLCLEQRGIKIFEGRFINKELRREIDV